MSSNLEKEIQQIKELYIKKKDYSELEGVKSEIKKLYDMYKDNDKGEVLAIEYFNFIIKLCDANKNKMLSEEEVTEVERVYNKYRNSKRVAAKYLELLYRFPFGMEAEKRYKTRTVARQIWCDHKTSQNVARLYFLIPLYSLRIEKISEFKNLLEDIFCILQKDPQLIVMVDIIIELIMDSKDRNKAVVVLKFLAENDEKKEILNQSRYSILYDFYDKFTDDELTKLLEIWGLIQKIKEQLIVKEPEKLKFGHYTSGKVLQEILKQKENTKYEITSRTRLSNVNYMNDPSEGKVLDQYLQLDSDLQQLSLKPSPWFLMSLTTAIDRLEMWAQYGSQAKGVCLILTSNDFLKGDLLSGPKMFKENRARDLSDFDLEENTIESIKKNRKKVNGDFIYRIGYLSKKANKEILLKSAYNTCLNKDEIKVINKSLKGLKERIDELDKNSRLYEIVDECLEEIRYLFKSEDYSYESELRILKYVPLEPDNKIIKIDDSDGVAKLYVERDTAIKLSEVIFGPKFPNPENVTPLLYLLDKNIKFRQSQIPFK